MSKTELQIEWERRITDFRASMDGIVTSIGEKFY